ncbi:potassium voltage-gated channel protein eag [Elysia marginata]|uniref:Potassium voltage-gated channel protein eag n=1 Tax=Elysia marginata TaxID=1093978 RepID=A0AAV4EI15_9GAST|nr:potassium voltage-gated channel protein eag [Elysia marginata]
MVQRNEKLIFRKVADVKKERELAEKRKNDPPLDLANDHPVRKLISRFRKISDSKHDIKATSVQDLECGQSSADGGEHHELEDITERLPAASGGARIITVSESPATASGKPAPRLGGASPWSRFLGGSSSGGGSADTSSGAKTDKGGGLAVVSIPMNDLSPKVESKSGEMPKVSAKPMAKWGRFLAKTQEPPIEEGPEDELRANLKKSDSTDSGALKGNSKLDQVREDILGGGDALRMLQNHQQSSNQSQYNFHQHANNHSSSNVFQNHYHQQPLNINNINNLTGTSMTRETLSNSSNSTNQSGSGGGGLSLVGTMVPVGGEPKPHLTGGISTVSGGLSAAEQHMLTSLYDIRLEIKEEIDSLRQKMNRIDEHISEVLRFFSPVSTPSCSSSVSAYPSSKFNSPQNITTSSSADQSPKNSISSSPRHQDDDRDRESEEEEDDIIHREVACVSPFKIAKRRGPRAIAIVGAASSADHPPSMNISTNISREESVLRHRKGSPGKTSTETGIIGTSTFSTTAPSSSSAVENVNKNNHSRTRLRDRPPAPQPPESPAVEKADTVLPKSNLSRPDGVETTGVAVVQTSAANVSSTPNTETSIKPGRRSKKNVSTTGPTTSSKGGRRRSSKTSNSSNESNHKHSSDSTSPRSSSGTPEPVPGRVHGSVQADVPDNLDEELPEGQV